MCHFNSARDGVGVKSGTGGGRVAFLTAGPGKKPFLVAMDTTSTVAEIRRHQATRIARMLAEHHGYTAMAEGTRVLICFSTLEFDAPIVRPNPYILIDMSDPRMHDELDNK